MTRISAEELILLTRITEFLEHFVKIDSTISISCCYDNSETESRFTSSVLPKITLRDYLHRIVTAGKLSQQAIIFALIYLKRFKKLRKYRVSILEIHR